MRENCVDQLFLGRFAIHGDDEALNQLGDLGPDHMRAKEASRFGVEDRLDEAVRFAKRDRLAVADEGEAADLDLEARLFGLAPR